MHPGKQGETSVAPKPSALHELSGAWGRSSLPASGGFKADNTWTSAYRVAALYMPGVKLPFHNLLWQLWEAEHPMVVQSSATVTNSVAPKALGKHLAQVSLEAISPQTLPRPLDWSSSKPRAFGRPVREHNDWPFMLYHDCLEKTGKQADLL